MVRFALLLVGFAALPACTWWTSEGHVLVTSDPAGAHLAVDGRDTGQTTPCYLPLGGNFSFDHRITITKKGHRPATRLLTQRTEGYTSLWIDGAYSPVMLPLPFFWTTGDILFPFAIRGALVPHELHVKLFRTDEPKLGFEVLAERAQTPQNPPPAAK
ncbi:MAG: PEGA domain-containing protein [Planctomycetes bacterium]|nr:PEGA domain-containing protein [Planctomycetota bacterium]